MSSKRKCAEYLLHKFFGNCGSVSGGGDYGGGKYGGSGAAEKFGEGVSYALRNHCTYHVVLGE